MMKRIPRGLLHDIGRFGLLAAYPVEYANLLSVAVDYSIRCQSTVAELFDIDHCEAGPGLPSSGKYVVTGCHSRPTTTMIHRH